MERTLRGASIGTMSAQNRERGGSEAGDGPLEVLIAGGGVAGLEAVLALHDLAPDHVRMTWLTPDPDFVYRPHLVEEPFSTRPAERLALAPIADELGASLVRGKLVGVDAEGHRAILDDGSALDYD